jgi:hypothetical protein
MARREGAAKVAIIAPRDGPCWHSPGHTSAEPMALWKGPITRSDDGYFYAPDFIGYFESLNTVHTTSA